MTTLAQDKAALIAMELAGPYTKRIGQPAYSDEAIEVLEDVLQPQFNVLEFGSGASTIWLAQKVWWVYTIEHNRVWLGKIDKAIRDLELQNVSTFLVEQQLMVYRELLPAFQRAKFQFDVILIDGIERGTCIKHCFDVVKPGGYVLLDDAHRMKYHLIPRKFKKRGWSRLTTGKHTTIWQKP